MDGANQLADLARESEGQTRRLKAAAAAVLGEKVPSYEPSEQELTAAEGAVKTYRKGKSRPRIREEMRRALKAAEAVRP